METEIWVVVEKSTRIIKFRIHQGYGFGQRFLWIWIHPVSLRIKLLRQSSASIPSLKMSEVIYVLKY